VILPRFTRRLAGVVTLAVTAGGTGWGCTPPAPESPAPASLAALEPTLELLATAVFPAQTITPDADRARLSGSLSGLAFDGATGHYVAVIDDRQPARIAWLDVRYRGGRLEIDTRRVEPLVPSSGVDDRRISEADLEAVVALPDGTFVAVEEGHRSDGRAGQPAPGVWQAALIPFSRAARATAPIEWPRMFDLGPAGGGIRDNQGAESLTRTPDGRLVAGLEQPRWADQPIDEGLDGPPGGGRPGRLIEFVPVDRGWRAARQWMYLIEPTRRLPGFDGVCDDGENGLTELLATSESTFLALERACLRNTRTGAVRNTAVVYAVSVERADDVSAVAALDPGRVRGASKRLVMDFDSLVPLLPPALAGLENFEALAFGPVLPDGGRTLLVASDDNFRETQKSAFLLFRIR
jgi:hypothetical protein